MRERTPLGSVPSPYVDVVKSVPPMGFARVGRSEAATRLAAPIAKTARRDADGLKPTGRLMTKCTVRVQALSTHATNNSHGGRAIEDDQPRNEDARHRVNEETRVVRLYVFLPQFGVASHHITTT